MSAAQSSIKFTYPAQFAGYLMDDLDEQLAQLDGNTYKVWSCLNRMLDSRCVNAVGQYIGWTVRVSQANLAARTNLSPATVKRCLKKLEAAGIIAVEHHIFGCNRYQLMGYIHAIEANLGGTTERPTEDANPTAPSVEDIDQFIAEDSGKPTADEPSSCTEAPPTQDTAQGVTGDPTVGHSCDPPVAHSYDPSIGQSYEPPNRPSLTDLSQIDSLSPPDMEPVSGSESNREEEREDLVENFYKAIRKPVPKSRKTRIAASREFEELVEEIAKDERVDGEEQASAILTDAFGRVSKLTNTIWDYRVMGTNYGDTAIEAAIHALPLSDSLTDEPENSQPRPERTETSIDASDGSGDTSDTRLSQNEAVTSKTDNIATIQWVLTASNYRDADHAVFIVQRRRPEFTREEVLEAIGTIGDDQTNQEDKMVSQGQRGSLERLSKHATVDGKATGWDAGCADVLRAIVTQDGEALAKCVGTVGEVTEGNAYGACPEL